MSADNFVGVFFDGTEWNVTDGSMSVSAEDDAYRGETALSFASYDEAILAANKRADEFSCQYGVLVFDRPESFLLDAPNVCISQVESLQLSSEESSVIIASDPDEGSVAFHVFVDEFGDMQVEIAAV